MSLPIHLQSIKSSGVYRFVYDKSVITGETAETLRLLVGYSDKGPFNTPVYISTRDEFIKTYGNISKRLEKKGVFFHRLALQALAAGPILCLNLKPFDKESVDYVAFNGKDALETLAEGKSGTRYITALYDTNRFWTLNPEDFTSWTGNQYAVITATDSEDASCSIIVRKAEPDEYKLTIREWFAGVTDEMPEYLEPIQDKMLSDYFADIYVFKGQFTPDLCGPDGPLGRYFNVDDEGKITLEENYTNAFGEQDDALTALANDSASNYIVGYRGTTIPFFKSVAGNYLSLDLLFNAGYSEHKMLMNMNESLLEGLDAAELDDILKIAEPEIDVVKYYEKTSETVVADTYYEKMFKNINVEPNTYIKYDDEEVISSTGMQPTEEGYIETAAAFGYYIEYKENDDLTDEEKEEAEEVSSVPSSISESSPLYIYTETSEIHFAYVEVEPTTSIKKKAVETDIDLDTYVVKEEDPKYIKITEVVAPNICPCYLKGYHYDTSDWTADNTASKCLGLITDLEFGKGLQEALTNRVDSEYHYIVDTFDTIAGPQGVKDKNILSALAKKKDNAFALLNFPKIKKFVDAGTMYKVNGTLDFKKVISSFPLPDDNDGASWTAYFTQVVLSDGTVKTTVPSAGLVSNLYLDKWTARQPYYIVAGSSFGRLMDGKLVGPDYAFSKTDRDVLEPYGINVIVYEPRRGTYINSEQTAKQVPVSGLSKIHIRELVIYLQNEIADLLESYRWWNNTQVLRDTIKAKADSLLSVVQHNGGVYDFLNVCDDSNNTPEMIDNELLVLDTHIEPVRGAGKMVEQLYIYRTGEMRSMLISG